MRGVLAFAIGLVLVIPIQGIPGHFHPADGSGGSSTDYRPYATYCGLAALSEIYLGRFDTIELGETVSGQSFDYVDGFLLFCEGGGIVKLSSVKIEPISAVYVHFGSSYTFTAVLVCDWGPCPSGATFSWSLDRPIGTLNSSTANPVLFTAGNTAGSGDLLLDVSLGQATGGTLIIIRVGA